MGKFPSDLKDHVRLLPTNMQKITIWFIIEKFSRFSFPFEFQESKREKLERTKAVS